MTAPIRSITAAPAHDASCDADDWWQQLTDPENEFGLSCTAYFITSEADAVDERNRDCTATEYTLIGVQVEDNYGGWWIGRDELEIDAADVWRLEKDMEG